MKIATWNVNSIRARLPNVIDWLKTVSPDVALLQELKTREETFPFMELEDLGYNIAVSGQKTWNGVAILSKHSIEDVTKQLPGADSQARYIEAIIDGHIRVASVYAPNGNPIGTAKFTYKLEWLDHLKKHISHLLKNNEMFVLGGDYNVAPTAQDVYSEKAYEDDAIIALEAREKFKQIMALDIIDAFRKLHPDKKDAYSYWSYWRGHWKKNHGVLLDFLLLSPQAEKKLKTAGIDTKPRGQEKASDHTPVWCTLDT